MRKFIVGVFAALVVSSLFLDVWFRKGAATLPAHAFDVAIGALGMYLTPEPHQPEPPKPLTEGVPA